MKQTPTIYSALCIIFTVLLAGCGDQFSSSESDKLNASNVHDEGDYYSADDVDSMIEETWIELNEEKPIPLDKWLHSNTRRAVEWISKPTAIDVQQKVSEKFGVTLCALDNPDLPEYTTALVAKIDDSVSKAALKKLLLSAQSPYQLSVRFGNRWVMYDAVLDEQGEYVPK